MVVSEWRQDLEFPFFGHHGRSFGRNVHGDFCC